jgi:hypothetical protein
MVFMAPIIELTPVLKKLAHWKGPWLWIFDFPDVRDCQDSHSQPLTDSDLLELEQQPVCNEKRNCIWRRGNCHKGIRADVSKFGTSYGFRSDSGKKHASSSNRRKRNLLLS